VLENAKQIIATLQLEPHREGGYFKRTFQADHRPLLKTESGDRFCMTSIYYLLSKDKPVSCFHQNKSDIMHVFHGGQAMTYYLIDEDGNLEIKKLGSDTSKDEHLQFVVKGGIWKASELCQQAEDRYDFGLLTEVVVPGFDYQDSTLASKAMLQQSFPKLFTQQDEQKEKLLNRLCFQNQ